MSIRQQLNNGFGRHKDMRPTEPVSWSRAMRLAWAFAPALGLAALLLSGCVEEETVAGHRPGDKVEFSVSTGYDDAPDEGDGADGDDGLPESMAATGDGNGTAGNGTAGSGESSETGDEEGLPETRTAYSGAEFTVSGSKWERIDWVNGDLFSVHCAAAHGTLKKADYKVVSHSASNANSLAGIAPATSQSLHWGTGQHVFYAMYPAASTPGVNASKVSLNGNVMRGTIPSAQAVTLKPGTRTYLPDMRYAYMYAATTVPAAGAPGPVNLWFKPMVTALEFTVDSGEDPTLSLYSFELSSSAVALTGDFTATMTNAAGLSTLNSYTIPPRTAANSKITVNFGGAAHPTVITKGRPITFTVFALPQNLTGLTAKFVTSKGSRTLALSRANGTSVIFRLCRKSRIATLGVPGRLYTFYLTATTPAAVPYTGGTASATVRSYKVNRFTGAQTAVPWQVAGYYANAACTVPYNGNATLKPAWLTLSGYSGTGSTTGEAQNATCAASPAAATSTQVTYNTSQSFLSSAAEVGSPTRYWNLANPVDGGDYIRESANCYIVNAPGYYRIPLVVGNGVKNNAPNAVAYTAANFKDYLDANISSPYLHATSAGVATPSYAFVIREEGGKFLDVIEETNWPLAPVPGTSSNLSITWNGAHNVYWLNFHISRANIRPATAVIGVRDAQGRIMWSWQIWLTDYIPKNYPAYASSGLKDIPVTNRTNRVYTFMPRNLGEVTYGTTKTARYDERRVYVKLTQNPAAGTATAVLAVTQSGMVEHLENLNPRGTHSPLYQFGRKDPIMGGNGFGLPIPTFFGVWPAFHGYDRELHSVGYSIQNPWKFFGRGYGTSHPYDWCSDLLKDNWWCAGNTERGFMDKAVVKTIYDPSPAGYHVPASNAFTGFTTTGENTPNENFNLFNVKDMNGDNAITQADFDIGQGWHFYTNATRTKTIHFVTQGFRDGPDGGFAAPFMVGKFRTAFAAHPLPPNGPDDYRLGPTCYLQFEWYRINPKDWYHGNRASAFSVRAVQD